MKTKKFILSLLFLLSVATLSGCLGYKIGSTPPAGVKKIYIPMFENRTTRQEITSDVTNGIVRRFRTDGTVKITDKEYADAILYGTITEYKREVVSYTNQDIGKEFRITIYVDIVLKDAKTGKVILKSTGIDGQAVTSLNINQSESEKMIMPDIIRDLSKNVVEAVLESQW